MSEHTDFSALEWVKGEISESLRQAQHALEAYVANPNDSTKMQFCITHLHQVWGTLQMVELEGASLFAAEMEALAQAVLDEKTSTPSEAQEVLMQAFLQLPTYLDNLVSGGKDMPVVLLPMLNDLRSTRGATLMSETVMFNPDLVSGHKMAQQREESAVSDLEDQLQKLRKAYQKSLLSVIKGEDMEKNLKYIGKILARLQKLSGKSQISQIWWISGAMIDGLLSGSIDFSKSVSSLLGAIDRQIKEMVDDHKKTLSSNVSKELAKNLLYYVASSEPSSKRIANVQKAYKLSKALPSEVRQEQSQQARRGLVNEAIVAAVDVLVEDLLNINENLDLVVRSKGKEDYRLKELLPVVKSIAGALHVLALKESRNIMAAQYKILGACVAGKVNDLKSELMGVAGQLLAVESNLNDIAKNGMSGKILIGEISNQEKVSSDQLGGAQKVLLNEAITSLETVKDLFGAMLVSEWKPEVLEEAVENLCTISGSLKIIPLPLASEVLDKSVLYVSQRLAKLDAAPEQSELETFADVLSSVDYFLEKLRTDSRTDTEPLLIGAERLAALGFALENTNTIKAIAATLVEESTDTEVLSDILESAEDEEVRLQAEEAAAKLSGHEATNSKLEQSTENAQSVIESNTETSTQNSTESETENVESTTSSKASDEEENVIDDEIIEIFIEEVGEVQETLNEFLPKWMENSSDEASLAEVRRAFHTLKGSGRMVGATEMGEMAWCIENMLNRLIDNSIKISDVLLQTVLDAVETVPELLALFKQAKNEATQRSNEISARAEAIAKGETSASESGLAGESAKTTPIAELAKPDTTAVDTQAPEYDQEIIDIFSQEALGHTQALKSFTDECREKVGPWLVGDDVLRTMHTLKGCANMAAIEPVAPVVTKAENFVKELRLLDKKANDDVISLIETVCQLTNQVINELPEVSSDSFSLAENTLENIAELAQNLLQNDAGDLEGDSGKQERIDAFLKFDFDIIFDGEDFFNDYLDAQENPQKQSEMAANLESLATECQQISAAAQENELEEISALATAIATACLQAKAQVVSEDYIKDLGVATHRLTEIVDFLAAGQFIKSPAKITTIIQDHIGSYPAVDIQADAVQEASDNIQEIPSEDSGEQALAKVYEDKEEAEDKDEGAQETALNSEQDADTVVEAIDTSENIMDDDIERDEEIVEIFLEEAEELIENSANLLDQWQDTPSDLSIVAELQRDLHTLKGGARMAEFASIGDLGHELENIYEAVGSHQLNTGSELFNLLFRCHDRISEMFNDIRAQGNCYRADDLLTEIKAFVYGIDSVSSEIPAGEVSQESGKAKNVEQVEEAETSATIVDEHKIQQKQFEQDKSESTLHEDAAETASSQEQDANAPALAEEAEPESAPEQDTAIQSDEAPKDTDSLIDEDDDSELDDDPELVEIFLEEAEEIIESSASALEEWRSDTDNPALIEQLQRELHTLKGGARMAQITEIGDFAHEMENIYEGLVVGSVIKSEPLVKLLFQCHDRLNEMITSLKETNSCEAADNLLEQLKLALVGKLGNKVEEKAPEKTNAIKLEKSIDPEVIEMFLNDGQEMVKQLEGALLQLQANQDAKDIVKTKELLAALSGGAKLSGFKSLAKFCESFEKLVEEQGGDRANHQNLMEGFKNILDFMALLETARPKAKTPEKPVDKKPAAKAKENKAAPKQKDSQAESIKISADLLENLVNLAGETSINRGRLEVQLSEFAFTIEEISGTIERLQEQLRRLHLETEAQIVFRHEKEGPTEEEVAQMEKESEDFDPLEMDRYSAIDQLSRSLSESASDLIDLKETLLNKTRDAETLLLQQGRVNTELQEGLMRSRMVPFSRLLPRLRRIVRQVGNELKKPVDLEILNAEGEMDRAVLERMISPIEHMLRNSIAHGIEKADVRKKSNKPKNGTISIDLGREGSNMLITLKDDGAGVNVEAVRKKAIENGLLDPDVDLPDNEIVEFIFNPGFSTAAEVSQVAGRGVGMDVVASEIKELGGSIETHSVTGSGTSFTIRLPFTVAVNRALMVTIGEDFYAIPLTSIEGVVRISPYELEAYYEQENPIFNYAGVDYELQYLGAYMHSHDRPHLLGQTRPLPVLLVQSGEHEVAMHVDSLLGSREIVVKSVGPQLSSVAGISGATILGDGSVVIILDIHSMIRGAIAQKTSASIQTDVMESKKKDRANRVMVVDDSVTVRKVTSRLLERNGMEVVLAKDGVDAITQLQEIKPDVMLLDIEMPRMDGFEVATLVRHDERLKDVPIIMITSRTGEKHKQRAMDIGVNRYMGKPFQESTLLNTIYELTSEKQGEKV